MFEPILAPLGEMVVVAIPALTPLYVVCLIVGGGLLAVSTIFGHGSHANGAFDAGTDALHGDADALLADADVDVGSAADAHGHLDALDAGGHAGAFSLTDWFSFRFVVFFLATFGLVGTALTGFTDLSNGATLLLSCVIGLGVGQTAHRILRHLKRSGVDSAVTLKDYLNKPARVTIAIRPHGRGEVAVQVGDRERFLPGVAKRAGDSFEVGAAVAVESIENGAAVVVSREEHAFLTDTRGPNGGAP